MSRHFDAKEYLEYRNNRKEGDPYFPPGTEHEDVYVVNNGRLFVWDWPKNEANKAVHGIDFYTAIYVFNDEDRLEDVNYSDSGAENEQIIGEPEEPIIEGHPIDTKHSKPKVILGEVEGVLFIVFVEEAAENIVATRIISARPADKNEVEEYFKWKYPEM